LCEVGPVFLNDSPNSLSILFLVNFFHIVLKS